MNISDSGISVTQNSWPESDDRIRLAARGTGSSSGRGEGVEGSSSAAVRAVRARRGGEDGYLATLSD